MTKEEINDLAYKYLDSEQTEGTTTKGEKAFFIQGFLQAYSLANQQNKALLKENERLRKGIIECIKELIYKTDVNCLKQLLNK